MPERHDDVAGAKVGRVTDRCRDERGAGSVDRDRCEITPRIVRGDDAVERAAVPQHDGRALGLRDVRIRDNEPIGGPDDARAGAGTARTHLDHAAPKRGRELRAHGLTVRSRR